MTSNRAGGVGTLLLLAVLIVGFAGYGAWAGPGEKTPETALETLEGGKLRLAEYRGKLVLVNFWAPWCPPCRQEMPDLQAFHDAHADTVVVGLAVDYRSRGNVANMADMMNITYPVAYASRKTAQRFGDFRGLPTTFLISPDGRIVGRHSGVLKRGQMERFREEHLPSADSP
ncbi:TlpA family protein disulfide reductase [Thiohalorhabdus sp. Cl-TMA]|uniref:TlpA family protein disulfide reductase n=1 Tax=Thiohalorhabdus methylotrophus TaxID=3242694 RepID=A0ABV4TY85_9GAMM